MKSKKLKIISITIVLVIIIVISFYKSGLIKLVEYNPNYYTSKQLQKLMDKDWKIREEVFFIQYYHNTSMQNIELRNNEYIFEKDMVIPREYIQKEMESIKKLIKQKMANKNSLRTLH